MSFSDEDTAPSNSDEELNIEKILNKACDNLLKNLIEDREDAEDDTTKKLAEKMMISIMKEERPLKTGEELKNELQKLFPFDCVQEHGLQSLAKGILKSMGKLQACEECREYYHWRDVGHNECYQKCLVKCQEVMQTVKKHILCQEPLDNLFKDERSLNSNLVKEIESLLNKEHWYRIHIQLEYCAHFKQATTLNCEPQSGNSSASEQLCTSTGEKKTCQELQRTDMVIGDFTEKVGYYIELAKNPGKSKIGSDKERLMEILTAERVKVPGNFHPSREKRVCYQIIFCYVRTPEQLIQIKNIDDNIKEYSKVKKYSRHVRSRDGQLLISEVHAWILKVQSDS